MYKNEGFCVCNNFYTFLLNEFLFTCSSGRNLSQTLKSASNIIKYGHCKLKCNNESTWRQSGCMSLFSVALHVLVLSLQTCSYLEKNLILLNKMPLNEKPSYICSFFSFSISSYFAIRYSSSHLKKTIFFFNCMQACSHIFMMHAIFSGDVEKYLQLKNIIFFKFMCYYFGVTKKLYSSIPLYLICKLDNFKVIYYKLY